MNFIEKIISTPYEPSYPRDVMIQLTQHVDSNIYSISDNYGMYIGQTIDFESRWKQHKYKANKPSTHISRAMCKRGIDSFTATKIVSNIRDNITLDVLEEFYISKYNTFKNGYNMTPGGRYSLGKSNIGKKYIKSNKPHARVGTHLSMETKRKMSNKTKGKSKLLKRVIHIYDGNGELQLTCANKSFKKFREEHNLPWSFVKSLADNIPLYANANNTSLARLHKNGYIKYVGWFARYDS